MIVATDQGLLYKMQQSAPGKSFIIAPTGGQGATCRSCAHCPWMGMNNMYGMPQGNMWAQQYPNRWSPYGPQSMMWGR